jgi:hypothetical protein
MSFLSSTLCWSIVPLVIALFNELICGIRLVNLRSGGTTLSLSFDDKSEEEEYNSGIKVVTDRNEEDGRGEVRRSETADDGVVQNESKEIYLSTKMENIKSRHFYFFLLNFFLLLPPVSRRQFSALNCFDLNGMQLLRVDTMVDCTSKQYQLFRVVNAAFIAVYMGIPLYWAVLIHRHRNVLNPHSQNRCSYTYLSPLSISPLSFFFFQNSMIMFFLFVCFVL